MRIISAALCGFPGKSAMSPLPNLRKVLVGLLPSWQRSAATKRCQFCCDHATGCREQNNHRGRCVRDVALFFWNFYFEAPLLPPQGSQFWTSFLSPLMMGLFQETGGAQPPAPLTSQPPSLSHPFSCIALGLTHFPGHSQPPLGYYGSRPGL